MRIKNLFTVPEGEKITEKALRRVLISSICTILLCMTCLVSTTWAWFTVSIENTGNEICIAAPTIGVSIRDGSGPVEPDNGVYKLPEGNYTMTLQRTDDVGKGSDLEVDRPVYAIMTVVQGEQGEQSRSYYVAMNETQFTFSLDKEAKISFTASWVTGGAELLENDTAVIGETVPETNVPETTVPEMTEFATDATESTTEATSESTTETTSPVV